MTTAEPEPPDMPAKATGTSGSLRNAAVAEIRRRITTGEMSPDTAFSEGTLCEELGMSRAPVREALIVLNQLGWVSSQPRSGYRVTPMTLNDLRDLYTMRSLLEPQAAAQAARKIDAHPDDAAALGDFDEHHDDPADREWLDRHYRYHRRIVVIGMNRELDRSLSEVLLKLERYFLIDSVQRALTEEPISHGDLTRAVLAGDHKAAADASALHISQSRLLVTEAILSSDGIRSAPLSRTTISSAPRGGGQ